MAVDWDLIQGVDGETSEWFDREVDRVFRRNTMADWEKLISQIVSRFKQLKTEDRAFVLAKLREVHDELGPRGVDLKGER